MVDFSLDAATRERLEQLRQLGAALLRPAGLEADRAGEPLPPEHPLFARLVQLGVGRTRWKPAGADPAEAGEQAVSNGATGPSLTGVCTAEEMAYWDRGVVVAFPGPGLGEPPILSMGSEEQKQRFLGPFRQLDRPRWGAFAMTEPGAGSDVAAIRTTARRDGREWILNGAKCFIGNASRADWIVVWATVDPAQGRAGHRAFVVERGTPGLGGFRVEKKMGLKAYESTSFTLQDCRVPAQNLLGGGGGGDRRAGFKGAMRTFNATRPIVAAMAVGIGRAALDEALGFAREQGLLERPEVRARIERIHRKLRMARLLCDRAAWLADRGRPNITEASMAKAVAPPIAFEATSLGMEILGEVAGQGDSLLEKLFRDVKAMDIVEGTGQIQRLVMARKLVGLPRE